MKGFKKYAKNSWFIDITQNGVNAEEKNKL
jgi:hypothetical protein